MIPCDNDCGAGRTNNTQWHENGTQVQITRYKVRWDVLSSQLSKTYTTMALPEITEKSENFQPSDVDKIGLASTSHEHPDHDGKDHLHFVPRRNELPDHDLPDDYIVGYDADLMRARATLSNDEEKKLMRRVDWHLIPLLTVIYAVKTVDAINVCPSRSSNIGGAYPISGLKCSYYG